MVSVRKGSLHSLEPHASMARRGKRKAPAAVDDNLVDAGEEAILSKQRSTEEAEDREEFQDATDEESPEEDNGTCRKLIASEANGCVGPASAVSPLADGQDPFHCDRPVRVYADGIYDLFHFGHARALEQAKKLFPNVYLMVGCCNDELTHKYKGKTVFTEDERYESLRHCKWVDEVVKDAPWVVTQDFIEKHNLDYVAHDALPYADASGSADDVYGWVKSVGKFAETKRTEGISTTDIIMRILKDYNQYIMRNLNRGYSRKEMGVSYVKEKQLRVNMGVAKLREKVKQQQQKVEKTVRERLEKNQEYFKKNVKEMTDNVGTVVEWVENADKWIAGFLGKFEEGVYNVEKIITYPLLRPRLTRQSSKKDNSAKSSPKDKAKTRSEDGPPPAKRMAV
eukprot:TRINITY_DN4589_c0_g1_i1.p1 TRINITY_DN4589_c0_g1~~TRINITY_DN4589_c0_g1_i1.p1  ORF type:complete len:396 (-),score=106.62 TRINITY_DN4589_c0_g1_i1:554-1741(-)